VNELLWFLMMALNFGAILLAYRLFGKTGLFIWIPISVIIANIQVIKFVTIFGLDNTLGNIVYATAFLVTDILSENYGKKEAKKAVYIGFFAIIVMIALMYVALLFEPNPFDESQGSLSFIFTKMPLIAFASLTAYCISQFHDVWAYHFWKKRKPAKKFIWIRNNASTVVSQFIDSTVFVGIAFLFTEPFELVFQIWITTFILKVIVAALDTPFIYIAANWKEKKVVI
jgi:queuosine precursor transporter